VLEEVRSQLLAEAERSPSLLSDLAGLERYVAESYDSRSFTELLQNADDASATRFALLRSAKHLLVANDGRLFSRPDFLSLCRSASSGKSRGSSIGYRGIGFKSVVGFARKVHLVSGELRATFSRELTAKAIPAAESVPLIRIPHPMSAADIETLADPVARLVADGYNTVFIFDGLIAGGIEKEFNAFDPTALLFLSHIQQVEVRSAASLKVLIQREKVDERRVDVRLATAEEVLHWSVFSRDDVAIAFAREQGQIKRLSDRDAVVHAFLPTNEPAGLGAKVHGDVSTDPSRTRVVLDERTDSVIGNIAALVAGLFLEALSRAEEREWLGMLAALTPNYDPRSLAFQRRSFRSDFATAIHSRAKMGAGVYCCRPPWLNAVDFVALAEAAGLVPIPRAVESIEGLVSYIRFLGASEVTAESLRSGMRDARPSPLGCAEVVAYFVQKYSTRQIDSGLIEIVWRLWIVDGEARSLDELRTVAKPLDRDFVDLITERSGIPSGLRTLLKALLGGELAETLLPVEAPLKVPYHDAARSRAGGDSVRARGGADAVTSPVRLSFKKWRGAEQQVLQLLRAQGWDARDVSRENIGYDIECARAGGERAYVEVKAIERAGQPFTLTSNEEAVARQRGSLYWLALVRQNGDFLEVALISDPSASLRFTRQCKQWVWECSEYDYAPDRYPVE